MDKIKEIFSDFFKWLIRFILSMIPYGLILGWATSCSPKEFGQIGMMNANMGIVYFILLIFYLYS